MNLDKFKVILCPTLDSTQGLNPDATVEAEYGDVCVEGTQVTLAHHGSRSANPAPCNTEVEPLEGGTILVSHLDLDTIGGIMALTGDKMEDKEFWEAAEFIDVNGSHHIHEFPQEIQDQLNAVYAWNASQARVRYTEATDVTQQVVDNYTMLSAVLDEAHPQHNSMIQKGKDWERDVTQAVQDKLVKETSNMRIFRTDGVFCSGSYYSPEQDKVLQATVVFNEKYKSITVAFEDGGKNISARDIVQKLWGPEAGGRDGIAGSPRGREMTEDDFSRVQQEVRAHLNMQFIRENLKNIIDNLSAKALFDYEATDAIINEIQKHIGYDNTNKFSFMIDEDKMYDSISQGMDKQRSFTEAIIGLRIDVGATVNEQIYTKDGYITNFDTELPPVKYTFTPEEATEIIKTIKDRNEHFINDELAHPESFGLRVDYFEREYCTEEVRDFDENERAFNTMVHLYQENPSVKYLMDFNLGSEPKSLMDDIKNDDFDPNMNYSKLIAALEYRFEAMEYSANYTESGSSLYKDALVAIREAMNNMYLEDYVSSLAKNGIPEEENKKCFDALVNAHQRMQFNSEFTNNLMATMKIDAISTKTFNPDVNYALALNEAYWKFTGALNVENTQEAQEDSWDNAYAVYAALKDCDAVKDALGLYKHEEFDKQYETELDETQRDEQDFQDLDDEEQSQ